MLDYAIVFALGFLAAGLLGFAMLPVVWRRALRLTRRELETGIPISMAEVKAGQDHIRAETAIELRRLEARLEVERDKRHAAMAEAGRHSETIRLISAENIAKDVRLGQLEAVSQEGREGVAEAQQALSGLKTELAAARVNLALHDQIVSEGKRESESLRMENDGLRVEIVATRTKLGTAEDDLAQRRRDVEELTASAVARDGKIALQAAELASRGNAAAVLENQLVALEGRLGEKTSRVAALEAQLLEMERYRFDLEARAMPLPSELAAHETALADREGRLAFAAGRERELMNEVARLKSEQQRAAVELAQGVAALRNDRQAIADQLETARGERARLQAEVQTLKREARESWLVIEEDNRQLRIAMARIAAEIARQAAPKPAGEAARLEAPRLSLPEPAKRARAQEA